jgi:hypothetical protein
LRGSRFFILLSIATVSVPPRVAFSVGAAAAVPLAAGFAAPADGLLPADADVAAVAAAGAGLLLLLLLQAAANARVNATGRTRPTLRFITTSSALFTSAILPLDVWSAGQTTLAVRLTAVKGS